MENGILVIPDVHGREFWEKAVEGRGDMDIIFLGDYLDPYPSECVFTDDALENFERILSFAEARPDNVTLLLGNHDMGYLDRRICTCRHDYFNERYIRSLLEENLGRFSLAAERRIGDTVFLFSHAGVNMRWVARHGELFPEGFTGAEQLNGLLRGESTRDALLEALADVSYRRGGDRLAGSPVWADLGEFVYGDTIPPGVVQVVGHTQLAEGWYNLDGYLWCMDSRRAHIIEGDGSVKEV